MTLDEKLTKAWEEAGKARQKTVVLIHEQRTDTQPVTVQQLDQDGNPKTIIVLEKEAAKFRKYGYKVAPKPKPVPKGVKPAEGEEEEAKAPTARPSRGTAKK